MAESSPQELVISSFKSQVGAGMALTALVDAGGDLLRGVKELALVRRGEDNRMYIEEKNDMGSGEVALRGGTIGALLGILGGPLGMLIGGATGALIGGVGGKLIDTGIPDERLKEIGALLGPNTSALVALVDPAQAGPLLDALAQGGGTNLTQSVAGDLGERIGAAREVAGDSATEAADEPKSSGE
jgi:uncharacterized membrane protein